MRLTISFGKQHQGEGIGFLGLLTIVFITLKLCHVINWSWWWVLAPLWFIPAIFIAIILIWLILAIIVSILSAFGKY